MRSAKEKASYQSKQKGYHKKQKQQQQQLINKKKGKKLKNVEVVELSEEASLSDVDDQQDDNENQSDNDNSENQDVQDEEDADQSQIEQSNNQEVGEEDDDELSQDEDGVERDEDQEEEGSEEDNEDNDQEEVQEEEDDDQVNNFGSDDQDENEDEEEGEDQNSSNIQEDEDGFDQESQQEGSQIEEVEDDGEEGSQFENSDQDEEGNNNEIQENDLDEGGRKKIYRRRADEIEKEYRCRVKKCGKEYGSYPALYTHLKTKHSELGGKKLYKIADKERKRIIKLETEKQRIKIEHPELFNDEEQIEEIKNNGDERKEKKFSKVKEFYVEEYMHLIKPSLVNEKQMKKLMKSKRLQLEEPNNLKYGTKQKFQIKGLKIQGEEDIEDDNQKINKIDQVTRKGFGTVEQMIQKSINKQLALAEIKKQQRNLKLQKIDKDKVNELTVFQPAYLFDLVQVIDITWKNTYKSNLKLQNSASFPRSLRKLTQETINNNTTNNKKSKKQNQQFDQENWLTDYPEVNDKNNFLLQPLQKQLEFLLFVGRELGVEEIQGIGLRIAFALKHLHGYVCKSFYIEMVYISSYLLRVLSIKKISQYQESLQEFLSIYEYVMNSVRYGGFAEKMPVFGAFADLNIIYTFPKNTLQALLKVVFKSTNAYSENLLKQFYHYNQSAASSF